MSDDVKVEPEFSGNTITIPEREGVDYRVGGRVVTGELEIKKRTVVTRSAKPGFKLAKGAVTSFVFTPEEAEKPKDVQSNGDPADKNQVKDPAQPVVATLAGSDAQNPAQGSRTPR